MRNDRFYQAFDVRRLLPVALFVCVLCVANVSCSRAQEENASGEVLEGVSYGPKEWNKLDFHMPAKVAPEKSRSAFVFVHGGAWTGGDRVDMRDMIQLAVKDGYVAATLDYMLYRSETSVDYSMEKVLDELDAAIAKVKELAADRGLKLDRVALGGDSAGGHIVSLYAYSRGKKAPLPVAFICPRVAPIDFHVATWKDRLEPAYVAGIVGIMARKAAVVPKITLGLKDRSAEETIDSVSPLSYLSKENFIPTVSAYSGADEVIGPKHCEFLRAKFAKLNARSIEEVGENEKDVVVFDCVEFPNAKHEASIDSPEMARFYELVTKYADRYLKTEK